MAQKPWLNADGAPLVNGTGAPYYCSDCPCGTNPTCHCLPGNTLPRLRVTVSWTGEASSQNVFGCSFANGESKEVCADHYANAPTGTYWYTGTNFTGERWELTVASLTYFRIAANPQWRWIKLHHPGGTGDTPAAVFDYVVTAYGTPGCQAITSNKTAISTITPASAAALCWTAGDGSPIADVQFGSLTNDEGVTISWERICGHATADDWAGCP